MLIIGILAAIALPQYTKAVEKSRAAEAMQVLGDLATAESLYYMANGNYTDVKGAPAPVKKAEAVETYKVLEPFTNWITRKKYVKGDKIKISESEMPGFADALDKGKLKKV